MILAFILNLICSFLFNNDSNYMEFLFLAYKLL